MRLNGGIKPKLNVGIHKQNPNIEKAFEINVKVYDYVTKLGF